MKTYNLDDDTFMTHPLGYLHLLAVLRDINNVRKAEKLALLSTTLIVHTKRAVFEATLTHVRVNGRRTLNGSNFESGLRKLMHTTLTGMAAKEWDDAAKTQCAELMPWLLLSAKAYPFYANTWLGRMLFYPELNRINHKGRVIQNSYSFPFAESESLQEKVGSEPKRYLPLARLLFHIADGGNIPGDKNDSPTLASLKKQAREIPQERARMLLREMKAHLPQHYAAHVFGHLAN